jgi:hypothetical protein
MEDFNSTHLDGNTHLDFFKQFHPAQTKQAEYEAENTIIVYV